MSQEWLKGLSPSWIPCISGSQMLGSLSSTGVEDLQVGLSLQVASAACSN